MPKKVNKRKDIRKYIIRRRIKKVISVIVIAFLCIYIPTIIILATSSKPDLSMLQNGTIIDSIKSEGFIFKDEQLYYAQFEGVFAKNAVEGEKVPAGYVIASVVNKDYIELFRQLESINKEIIYKKQNSEINSGIFTRDLKEIEENIKKSINEITKMVYSNGIMDVSFYLEQINRYQEFRNEIIGGLGSNNIYIEDLETQAKQLELSFKEQIFEIETSSPGYVTYIIDGFENEYDYNNIINYSPVDLLEIMNKKIEATNNSDIIAGEPFVKMIYGNSCYIAFVLTNEQVDEIKKNESVYLNIKEPSISIKSKNIIIGKSDEEKTCIYIEIDSKLNELNSIRKIEVEIILSEYTGYKVPLSSLINIDSYPYKNIQIGVVKNNYVTFVDVNILMSDGTFAIIESVDNKIALYDFYVVKAKKVEEGQIVK